MNEQPNIINSITKDAQTFKPEDLENILPKIVDHYKSKIKTLSYEIYGNQKIAEQSFFAQSSEVLYSGASTFLFKKQHWKNNRDLNSYLRACLNNLAYKTLNDLYCKGKRIKSLLCPLCKEKNNKEFVIKLTEDLVKCIKCESKFEILNNLLEKDEVTLAKINLYKIFSQHSIKGKCCPDCLRFLPIQNNENISCPYLDCCFTGNFNDLEDLTHPFVMVVDNHLSLNKCISNGGGNSLHSEVILQDLIPDKKISADQQIEINEEYYQNFISLQSVFSKQIDKIKRTSFDFMVVRKTAMVEAYNNIFQLFPSELINHLFHQDRFPTEFVFQARIFQEYVKIMENKLPFKYVKKGNNNFITSLTDPVLNLFLGESCFSACVDNNGYIPNLTNESYFGERSIIKKPTRCFIGSLISAVDDNSKSLMNNILDYSWSQIHFDDKISYGTKVTVKHFRVAPHYETGPLILLQQTRKNLIEAVEKSKKYVKK